MSQSPVVLTDADILAFKDYFEAGIDWTPEFTALRDKFRSHANELFNERREKLLRERPDLAALTERVANPDTRMARLVERNVQLETALLRLTSCENMAEYEPGYINKEVAERIRYARQYLPTAGT